MTHNINWSHIPCEDNETFLAFTNSGLDVFETISNMSFLLHTFFDAFVKLFSKLFVGHWFSNDTDMFKPVFIAHLFTIFFSNFALIEAFVFNFAFVKAFVFFLVFSHFAQKMQRWLFT